MPAEWLIQRTEAFQYDGTNGDDVYAWGLTTPGGSNLSSYSDVDGVLTITSSYDEVVLQTNDWLDNNLSRMSEYTFNFKWVKQSDI